MDTQKLRELLDELDDLNGRIAQLVGGARIEQFKAERKPQKCGTCGQEGHSARTCPSKEKPNGNLALV